MARLCLYTRDDGRYDVADPKTGRAITDIAAELADDYIAKGQAVVYPRPAPLPHQNAEG